MPLVTITIEVDETSGETSVLTGGGAGSSGRLPGATAGGGGSATEAAPLDSMAGADSTSGAAEDADPAGPPPMELSRLGISGDDAVRTSVVGNMSPPIDFDDPTAGDLPVESDAADLAVAPEDVGDPDD